MQINATPAATAATSTVTPAANPAAAPSRSTRGNSAAGTSTTPPSGNPTTTAVVLTSTTTPPSSPRNGSNGTAVAVTTGPVPSQGPRLPATQVQIGNTSITQLANFNNSEIKRATEMARVKMANGQTILPALAIHSSIHSQVPVNLRRAQIRSQTPRVQVLLTQLLTLKQSTSRNGDRCTTLMFVTCYKSLSHQPRQEVRE